MRQIVSEIGRQDLRDALVHHPERHRLMECGPNHALDRVEETGVASVGRKRRRRTKEPLYTCEGPGDRNATQPHGVFNRPAVSSVLTGDQEVLAVPVEPAQPELVGVSDEIDVRANAQCRCGRL